MKKKTQILKANKLRSLHHGSRILILPNIWDPLGARMLQFHGYPAVATASTAVAFSLGCDDGQKIAFAAMLDAIRPDRRLPERTTGSRTGQIQRNP